MSQATLYALAAVMLCAIGLHAVIAYDHLLRKILALNVLSSGVFLLFVAIARRVPDAPPDPVPHAMVLTGIVVAVSATALGLALTRRIVAETGRPELSADEEVEGSSSPGEKG
jgi:multicomponent Na+:H+ antiporter subunit C